MLIGLSLPASECAQMRPNVDLLRPRLACLRAGGSGGPSRAGRRFLYDRVRPCHSYRRAPPHSTESLRSAPPRPPRRRCVTAAAIVDEASSLVHRPVNVRQPMETTQMIVNVRQPMETTQMMWDGWLGHWRWACLLRTEVPNTPPDHLRPTRSGGHLA